MVQITLFLYLKPSFMKKKYWTIIIFFTLAATMFELSACTNDDGDENQEEEVITEEVTVRNEATLETPENTPTELEQLMEDQTPSEDDSVMQSDAESMMQEIIEYTFTGQLADATRSQTVEGINTGGSASGTASSVFVDGVFKLRAEFEGLPDPQGTDFYEGWLIRTSPTFDVISTGPAVLVDGFYVNTYASETDYTSHAQYVLTIEPDDGDPAPAWHVLEGNLSPVE